MGPLAAGKSLSRKYWFNNLNTASNSSEIYDINVDSIVEENGKFRDEMKDYFDKNFENNIDLLQTSYQGHLDNNETATNKVMQFCTDTTNIYFSYRKEADIISNSRLLDTLMYPNHKTVFYETTGSNRAIGWMEKVIEISNKVQHYDTHLAFTYSDLKELKKRALNRAVTKKYRLPCLNDIEQLYNESVSNLCKLIDKQSQILQQRKEIEEKLIQLQHQEQKQLKQEQEELLQKLKSQQLTSITIFNNKDHNTQKDNSKLFLKINFNISTHNIDIEFGDQNGNNINRNLDFFSYSFYFGFLCPSEYLSSKIYCKLAHLGLNLL